MAESTEVPIDILLIKFTFDILLSNCFEEL